MDYKESGQFLKRDKIIIDSKIEVKYPEKTWSVEQSYRDIFQNHLDAQFKNCVDELLNDLSTQLKTDPQQTISDKTNRKIAYEYLATKGAVDDDIEKTIVEALIKNVKPVEEDQEFQNLRDIVSSHSLKLPKVEVLVRTEDQDEWKVDTDISTQDLVGSQIVGFRISDEGVGYDANLKAILYSSQKESPDQIGKFGEGGKMSEILLQQKGFWIESRSSYSYTDQDGSHNIVWKSRPRKSKDNSMELHVTQVEVASPVTTGSVTEIRFSDDAVNWKDRETFVDCIRPSRRSQILYNSRDGLEKTFIYPHYDPTEPLVGISARYEGLMVQGIRVDPVNTDNKLLFGYSSFDKDALDARDRNKFSDKFIKSIEDFWLHASRPTLRAYLDKFDSKGIDVRFNFLESVVLNKYIQGRGYKEGSATSEIADILKGNLLNEILIKQKCAGAQKLYFRQEMDRGNLERHLDFGTKVVDTNRFGLFFPESFLEEFLGDRYVSPSDVRKTISEQYNFILADTLSETEGERAAVWFSEVQSKLEALTGEVDNEFGFSRFRFIHPNFVKHGDAIAMVTDGSTDWMDDYRFDENKVLQINWDKVKNGGFERELEVYLLAHSDFGEFSLYKAQDTANKLIGENWESVVDYSNLGINYEVDKNEFIKLFEGLRAVETARSIICFETLQKLSTSVVDEIDIDTGLQILNEFDKADSRVKEILLGNVFRTKDGFTIYEKNGDEFGVKNFGFDDMTEIAEVDGKKVYLYGDFIFIDLPQYEYAKHGDATVYKYEGTIFRSTPEKAIAWEVESEEYSLKFGEGYCYQKMKNKMIDPAEFSKKVLDKVTFVSKKNKSTSITVLGDGHIKTAVSLEYGKGNWDKPVRFFEDVVQNHLNAGEVKIKFLVNRNGQNIWISQDGFVTEDKIIGIEFVDNGPGYAPESLERMGRSDKDSPLDEGKYGEGTKMLMAAASRNQIDLEFSSFCIRDKQKINWRAKAEKSSYEIIQKGAKTNVSMSGFDLESYDFKGVVGSSTKIIFTDFDSDFYKSCVTVIDPRLEGGGLSRYVRTLPNGVGISSSVGPVKVLNNLNGDIFENGLLVATQKTLLGSLDVPDVTATRERDTLKETKLHEYVHFLMSHTSDEMLIKKALGVLVESGRYNYLDVQKLFEKSEEFPLNIGLWREVADNDFAGVIVDDTSMSSMYSQYLQYSGYHKRVYVHGKEGKDMLLKTVFPTVKDLIEKSKLVTVDIPLDVQQKTEKAIDLLSDNLLKIIDTGNLPEATNGEFVKLLRNKTQLHDSIKYSKLHPFILGEAKGKSDTLISEYLLHNTDDLNMVILHEWAHHLSDSDDLDIKFIACLLGIAEGVQQNY